MEYSTQDSRNIGKEKLNKNEINFSIKIYLSQFRDQMKSFSMVLRICTIWWGSIIPCTRDSWKCMRFQVNLKIIQDQDYWLKRIKTSLQKKDMIYLNGFLLILSDQMSKVKNMKTCFVVYSGIKHTSCSMLIELSIW